MRTSAFLIALLAAPALADTTAPTTVIVVRHAEKVDGPGDPTLNELGQQRADELARMLKSTKVSACYCTQFQRTKLTAQPTAKAAGIVVVTHPAGKEGQLVKKILSEHAGKRVLIAAHSNTVPMILRHLGHENDLKIEEEDYDNLFIVRTLAGSKPDVLHLHYGAANKPSKLAQELEPR